MADATRVTGTNFKVSIKDELTDEWIDIQDGYPGFVGMDLGLSDLNIEVTGVGEMDKLSLAEWLSWRSDVMSPSPWADDLSFRAVTIAANTLENDSWVPIDNDGRLPYAAWI